MRSTWTDSRLDELSRRTDDGFKRVDEDIRELRVDVGTLRLEMNARFDSLQRTLIQFGGGLIASFLALIVTFVLTQH